VFHLQAGLEDDNFTRRDRDTLTRAGISSEARFSFLDLEYAEIAELNFLGAHQAIYDNVKGLLNNPFDIHLLDAGHIGYAQNYIFLRH